MERERKLQSKINNSMDSIYKNIYSSDPTIEKRTNNIISSFDKSMDKLISKSRAQTGNNISQLYVRTALNGTSGGTDTLDQMFNNNANNTLDNIMYSYMDNRLIKIKNTEIDLVCVYLPTLLDALAIKKDAILSADVFNKNYINILNTSNEDELDRRDIYNKVELLKDKYNLEEVIEESVDDVLKYGEVFHHIVDYNTAFERLLKASNNGAIYESFSVNVNNTNDKEKQSVKNTKPKEQDKINITMTNGLVGDVTKNKEFMDFVKEKDSKIHEQLLVESGVDLSIYNKLSTTNYNNIQKDFNSINDGLTVDNVKNTGKVNINGSIRRTLLPENIKAIYIEDSCLGYLYIETQTDAFELLNNNTHNMLNNMGYTSYNTSSGFSQNMQTAETDLFIRDIASVISKEVDAKFINANADLSEEIYTMLKYNVYNPNGQNNVNSISDIRVSFIDPSEIIHFYYNKDKKTHRGISDLQESLFPAKLYSALYIFTSIGVLTRSQDKRAYMVKQHVDSNIAKVLLNAINQIKKGNMGVREVNDITNLFNISGAYTDMFIPESASGERPINFEIIPGQEIDSNEEILDRLKTMAINPIGVPEELLDMSVQIEFAIRGTTSNSKFARHILKRQAKTEKFIDIVVNTLYANEYHIDNKNKSIELSCLLPPPSYLTIQSTLELFSSAKEMVDQIIEMDVPTDEQDEPWVMMYKNKLMKKYMSLYIDYDEKEQMIKDAKMEAMKYKDSEEDE